eukprot:m.20526 g.20526  ORF g.20526 m.20526 type:complete len:522 (+) comp12493_c0_seq1:104-1669(+)
MATPAMLAAKQGRIEQLQILEKYNAGEEVTFKSHQGQGFTTQRDPTEEERARAEVKVQFQKETVFLDAASQCDGDTVLQMLGEGMDPNVCNADGLTALHQCCIENSLKVASILLLNGANVNARDNDWWTPLHAAAACGHWRVTNFLLSHGADVTSINADGDLPIDLVEGEKTEQILREEMERLGITEEQHDELREKPHKEFMTKLDEMIKNDEDLNKKDWQGATLLHSATCNGFQDAVEKLLEHHAKPDIPDEEGNTCLHLASFFQQYRIAEVLGKHGSNIDAQNRHLETPIVLTEDVTMIRLLKAMKNNQELESAALNMGIAGKANSLRSSSVKRRSVSQKQSLAKTDIRRESHELESNYAELSFSANRPQIAGGAPSPIQEEPGKNNTQIVYADVDFKPPAKTANPVIAAQLEHTYQTPQEAAEAQQRAEAKAAQEQDMSQLYKTPNKKNSGSKLPETKPPTPVVKPSENLPPDDPKNRSNNPKFLNRDTHRKGSLAAIALEEGELAPPTKKGCGCTIL